MLAYFSNLCQAQLEENWRLAGKWWNGLPQLASFTAKDPTQDGAPRTRVYEDGQMELYHYAARGERTLPLVIVYALVNKPYMLDLAPHKSFLRTLGELGTEVYLTVWKDPGLLAQKPDLTDYIEGSIDNAIRTVGNRHAAARVNLMGICQGGTLSLIYTALHPERVSNLVTVVTPLDFHAGNNLLTHLAKDTDAAKVSDVLGSLSGDMLNWGFLQLKPFELMFGKYLGMLDILDDTDKLDFFMRMEKWIFDGQAQSGPAWQQFIRDCYQDNKLMRKQMAIAGRTVDLTTITCPLLNVMADKDHLVPTSATQAIHQAVSSQDYSELKFPVGHIGMFVGDAMKKKIVPSIADWLHKHN